MPAVMKYSTTSPNPMTRRSPGARMELVAACSDGCMDAWPPGWRRTAAGVYARPGRDAREDGRVLRPRNGVHSGRRAEGREIVPDEDPRAGPAPASLRARYTSTLDGVSRTGLNYRPVGRSCAAPGDRMKKRTRQDRPTRQA